MNEKDKIKLVKLFPICFVCREDLCNPIVGFSKTKALKMTDEQMRRIADKLAKAYVVELFIGSLSRIIEDFEENQKYNRET